MIQLKHSEFSLPGLERHTEKLLPFYLSYDKPFGELALGEKYKDYQSGQVIEFSRYVFGNTDRIIRLKCYVTVSFMLKCRNKFHPKSCCLSYREKSVVLLTI